MDHPIIERLLPYRLIASALHGPAHWARVHRFAVLLAEELRLAPAQRHCVEVFAWTHGLARQDDGGGNAHAIEGAEYLDTVLPAVFPAVRPIRHGSSPRRCATTPMA